VLFTGLWFLHLRQGLSGRAQNLPQSRKTTLYYWLAVPQSPCTEGDDAPLVPSHFELYLWKTTNLTSFLDLLYAHFECNHDIYFYSQ
jgi:hypothetical protein